MTNNKQKVCLVLCKRKECPTDIDTCDGKKAYICQKKKKSFLNSLNEKQTDYIVSNINDNIFLKACPGSGKTEVLGVKCAYENVLWDKKSQGYAILTFTNSAEDEIRERIEVYLGEKLIYPHFLGTFTSWVHGYIADPFLYKITGYKGDADKDKSIRLIESLSKSDFLNIFSSNYGYVELGNIKAHEFFRDFKNDEFIYCGDRNRDGKAILQNLIKIDDWREKDLEKLKNRFWEKGYYLYEDIEYLVYLLLEKNEEITKLLAKRFPVIFVDECQDLSYVQLEIMRLLIEKGCKVHLIGDLDQSIYAFRDIDPLDTFDFIYELKFKELKLDINYRSCQKIVDISDLIINRNSKIEGLNENKLEKPLIALLYKKDKENEAVKSFNSIVEENGLEIINSRIIVRNNGLGNKLRGIKHLNQSSNLLEDIAMAIYLFKSSNEIGDFKTGFLLLAKSIQKIYFKSNEHLNSTYFYKPSAMEMSEWKSLLASIKDTLIADDEICDFSKTWTLWKKSLKSTIEKSLSTIERISDNEFDLGSIRSGNANKTLNEILFKKVENISEVKIETIHGCKGMSLDAVLCFSSYQATKETESGAYWRQWFDRSIIDEKNRLAYVAFSRAKYLLVLAIPKPSTFTVTDRELLIDSGFEVIDLEKTV